MPTIKEIEEKLRQASKAYYNSDKVDISDADFDKLKNELQQLDPDNAFLKEIGAPVVGVSLKHDIPVGSLEKCKNKVEFMRWVEKIQS